MSMRHAMPSLAWSYNYIKSDADDCFVAYQTMAILMTRFTDRRESAAVRVFAIARLHDGRTVADAAGKTTANFQLSSSFIILWPHQRA